MVWTYVACVLMFVIATGAVTKIADDEIVTSFSIESLAGGVATLPCDMSPPVPEDTVHLVIWYKDTVESPIYSLDARETDIQDAKHWSDPSVLGNRGQFKFADSPAKLTVQRIRESDAGMYRCRVDFKKSPTRNTKVNLTVIVPPERLSVLDEQGNHIQHYILGPYDEGVSVDITCIASGGRPLPRVTWWQENTLLDESYEILPERRVRNILHLDRLERQHLNTVFTCQASNNNFVTPISSAVTLDLNLQPLWVRLVGENRALSADQTYQVSCEVVGGRPLPIISWWKGSLPFRTTKESISDDANVTVSTLTFVPAVEDSGKVLTCRAAASHLPAAVIEDSWILNVFHLPLLSLALAGSVNESNVQEGSDVYFECNIQSNPWVYRLTWKHNGKTLFSNASAGTVISNQSLFLQSVTRSHAGTYTCIGSNQEGDGESNPVFLDVKFSPVCRPGQLKIVGAPRKESVTVACEVEANPLQVDIFWKFSNTNGSVDIPSAQFTVDSTRSLLEYTALSESDYGTLTCWAKNDQGTQTLPCVYHVIPAAGRPEELVNCSITNQTLDSLYIVCEPGYDGGLPQEFLMEVYESHSGVLVSSVSSQSPWFSVKGLSSGMGFDIGLYAQNTKGRSAVFILHAYPLESAARRTALSPVIIKLTPVLGILVGILVSLTLLFMGILLLLRLRHRGYNGKKAHNTSVKVSCESVDSTEKNPDVIPQSTDIQDPEETEYEQANFYNNTRLHTKDSNNAKNEEYTGLQMTSGLLRSVPTPQLSERHTVIRDDASLICVTSGTLDRRRTQINDQLTRF